MHEMSLCEALMQVIEEQSGAQGFSRVKKVWLEIGELAAVESESMRLCFEVITQGTLAERAELVIIPLPGEGWCESCQQPVRIRQRFDACPHCGGYALKVTSGDEMRIKELEVV